MAPTVEKEFGTVKESLLGLTAQVMVVQLDSDDKLDIELFDKQARTIANTPLSEIIDLKWVVYGNNLFVFSEGVRHDEVAYSSLVKDMGGELKGAGFLQIHFSNEGTQREISGYSFSLRDALPIGKSQEYKISSLKPLLGEYFEVF